MKPSLIVSENILNSLTFREQCGGGCPFSCCGV